MNRKILLSNINSPKLTSAEREGNPETLSVDLINLETISTTRAIKYPRASSIYDSCIRMHSIGTLHGIEKTERVHLSRRLTFDIGNSIHYWLQNSHVYLGDQRRGIWECQGCKHKTFFGKPPRQDCPVCNAKLDAFIYSEIDLELGKPYYVTGHPDMFLESKGNPGVIRIAEFKTINGDKFSTLKAPLINHIWQLQCYMWMVQENDQLIPATVDGQYGYIIYISKSEKYGELPFKTFFVKRDRAIIQKIKDKLILYSKAIAGGALPPVLEKCKKSDWSDYVAKSCACKELCKKL